MGSLRNKKNQHYLGGRGDGNVRKTLENQILVRASPDTFVAHTSFQ